MNTQPVTAETLKRSVVAVPPLARGSDLSLCREENVKLIRHIEAGGVSTLLYGGNANFYHLPVTEYGDLLNFLADAAADTTTVIPSAGPAYGTMMDQAAILGHFDFPTVMVLPQQGIATSAGVATGVRHFVEAFGKPVVLYIKFDGYLEVDDVGRLMDDDLISVIKYATVRDDTADDDYLARLVERVDRTRVMSGIGEQPAIVHLRDFGLGGFTSGCVCVAPRLSMDMLAAIQAGDFETAESIRRTFQPLEDLRNGINPIRVLHEAVTLSGIADMGEILPLLSRIDEADRGKVKAAASELLSKNARPAVTS